MAELRVVRGSRQRDGLRERARELRRAPTDAERVFWGAVRGRRLAGLRFRRQQPLEGFIVDFYCHALRLAVELDGGVHDAQRERDAQRDDILRARGVQVLRLSNEEVLFALDSALQRVLARRSPLPLGEGLGVR